MSIEEFKLSLLIMGWTVDYDTRFGIEWKKDGCTLHWDKEGKKPLEQLVHYEQSSDLSGIKEDKFLFVYAFSTFEECIREIQIEETT